MPEEQTFCVLVKIMYEYGLRSLYKNNFEELHCKFYQLEKLMQVRTSLVIWQAVGATIRLLMKRALTNFTRASASARTLECVSY